MSGEKYQRLWCEKWIQWKIVYLKRVEKEKTKKTVEEIIKIYLTWNGFIENSVFDRANNIVSIYVTNPT